ncbi:MAG: 6,7-dimethyl-8-ribityllumazine synthase [Flavobacteriales bacterium]|nr:6,7-dimethyl-8-ribityllumazine synthase [Flavobacteriales bacterium]
MATNLSNLSEFDAGSLPNASEMRVGIVASEWNSEITDNLLKGAHETLLSCGMKEENVRVHRVPGSFELALGAQFLLESSQFNGVICLGSVIRGETAHFDFVCQATSKGIMDVGLKFNRPVVFGVLTDDTIDQSRARSGGIHGNKGVEAAVTVLKMIALQQSTENDAWLM